MEKYYGQHGEDFLLDKVFGGKKDGFYVEIGCLDGIEFSNTYFFEKKGWKGICVEAHNDFISLLKTNRPNATVVHCAVGEKDVDEVTFYANKIGSLSTLDKTEEARWQEHYKSFFHGFEEQKVKMRTLNTIFEEQKVPNIDFVSLDIEGYEIKALEGLNLKQFRPHIFIIEYKDEAHKSQLEDILIPAGYHMLAHLGCNLFYGLNPKDKAKINASYGKVQLVTLDSAGKETVREILLEKKTALKKVKQKLASLKNKLAKK